MPQGLSLEKPRPDALGFAVQDNNHVQEMGVRDGSLIYLLLKRQEKKNQNTYLC